MSEYKIEMVPIESVIPYARNPRHNNEAVSGVVSSIKEFGFRQPIVVDKDNVIVVGHTRLLAAQRLGYKEVPIHRAENLTEQQVKAYRIADNKTNEAAQWDKELLLLEIEEVGGLFTGFTEEELAAFEEEDGVLLDDDKYTKKIETPVYKPTGEQPELTELFDNKKTIELITEIDKRNIPDEVKEFLKLAAYRHVVFNYRNIAEYYCHCDKDIQDLFEQSALVIIDFDKAIENGYIEFVDRMKEILTNPLAEIDGDEE